MDDWAPACCGSGCAVCVLDNLDEPPQPNKRDEAAVEVDVAVVESAALCCGTGCTVCVLDLPAASEGSLEELLDAFEGALSEGRGCPGEETRMELRSATPPPAFAPLSQDGEADGVRAR